MELHAAEQLVLRLMKQFGLTHNSAAERDYYEDVDRNPDDPPFTNWRFEWDDAKRRFGSCCKRRRVITLSRSLVSRNELSEVEDCIRHEIAHALAPDRAHHNHEWKKMCAVTGAKPERCYAIDDVEQEAGDWKATCEACKHVFTKFRKPRRELFCSRKPCKAKLGRRCHPLAKLTFRHKNEVLDFVIEPSVLTAQLPSAYRRAVDAMKAQLREQEGGNDVK